MRPKVLIATTTWFAIPARVALSCIKSGSDVSAVLPSGNPIEKVSSLKARFRYSALKPLESLSRAILAVKPDLIIPCDDRVVEHLHLLHAQSGSMQFGEQIRSLIETSIGAASGYPVTLRRGKLLECAEQFGVRIPETAVVCDLNALKSWIHKHGCPAVLKIDGTWGGTGVRIVHSMEEAETAYYQLTRPLSRMAIMRLLSSHDLYPLYTGRRHKAIEITVQAYIEGHAANTMLACWDGKVLDDLSVQTLFAVDPLGSSTVVQTIVNDEMSSVGSTLIRNLRLSGFCGFDFIIERTSGHANLIELNPRITQLGHLELVGKPSLINTLLCKLRGESTVPSTRRAGDMIAFFPHILRCDPEDPIHALPNLYVDVPHGEPRLIQELMRKPWNSRHVSSLLFRLAKKIRRRSYTKQPWRAEFDGHSDGHRSDEIRNT